MRLQQKSHDIPQIFFYTFALLNLKMCNFVIPVKYRATLSTKTQDFSPEKIFNRLHGAERDARLLQQPTRRVGSLDAAFLLSTFLGAHPANKTLENQHLEPKKGGW